MNNKNTKRIAEKLLTYLGTGSLTSSTDNYAIRIHPTGKDPVSSQLLTVSTLDDGRILISSFCGMTGKIQDFLQKFSVSYRSCLGGCPEHIYILLSENFKFGIVSLEEKQQNLEGKVCLGIIEDYYDNPNFNINSYIQKVDAQEKVLCFVPLKPHEAIISQMDILKTQVCNLKRINDIYNTPEKSLNPEDRKLKEIVDKCTQTALSTEIGSIKMLGTIYNMLSECIKIGDHKGDCLSIEQVLNGERGVCRDIATTFYSLFTFFRIKAQLIFGKLEDIPHVWLRVESEGETFELDPTWYHEFVPLKIRNYDCKLQ